MCAKKVEYVERLSTNSNTKEVFMNNKAFQQLIYRAAVRQPFSASIAMRVYVDDDFLKTLIKYGTGKPIIVIVGKAGYGNTSSVTSSIGEHKVIKFAEGLKNVKNLVQKMRESIEESDGLPEPQYRILVLDNFPTPISKYKLEIARRILDYIVDIFSEDENAPLLIITGEPQILDELEKEKYLIGRTIPVEMCDIDKDKELYDIRNGLVQFAEEYKELWMEYRKWARENPVSEENLVLKLSNFRKKYGEKYENRRIGQVFCYYYSLHRFSCFLEKNFGCGLEASDIEHNIEEMLGWKETFAASNYSSLASYEVSVWNLFIETSGAINAYIPRDAPCPYLNTMSCDETNSPYACAFCTPFDEGPEYNMMDLRLPSDAANAVLIPDPRKIPFFPKHIPCQDPLLMVRNTAILSMLNLSLEEYARKNRVSMKRVMPKRFTKELFSHNLCLFQYVSDKHNTYTFHMKDVNGNDKRAIFIKLTAEQYRILEKNAQMVPTFASYPEKDVKEMGDCLKYFGEKVHSLIGEVGMKADFLTDDDEV